MKNTLKAITRPIRAFGQGFKNIIVSLKDLKEARRIEKTKSLSVFFIEGNKVVRRIRGQLDESEKFVFLPEQNRVFINMGLYYNEKLQPIVFVSTNNHQTVDISEIEKKEKIPLSIQVPSSSEIKVTHKKNPKPYQTIDLSDKSVGLTLEPQLLDKKRAFDFTVDAYKILKTKKLEILEEPSRRQTLIVAIVFTLIGMVLAGTGMYGMLLYMS